MTVAPYQNRPIKSAFVRKAYASMGDDATLSRWVKVPHAERKYLGKPRSGWLFDPSMSRPARSIFYHKGVKKPSELKTLFVSGHSNVKIGRDVRKGLFRGYWIYTLSLEERATCPTSCRHWLSCYGNNMPYSKRIDHTEPGFMARLAQETHRLYRERQAHPLRDVRTMLVQRQERRIQGALRDDLSA